ncbi:MAG: DJ-1/PfpI family protein [Lachnospiraceae bacterium]|nr:DJ-1/PfpI family protein [Lachnospiraceae bacterium]
MNRIAVFFATGYEEIEALTVVDLCRRAGIQTDMVSVTGEFQVVGSHGIGVAMDQLFEEVDFEALDMIVLPGGMPGTKNLEAHQGLMEQTDRFYQEGKGIAAICAAPSILGHRGYLKGRDACAYPGFESHLEGARVSDRIVEVSDHVITSRGMGCAVDFGLAIVEYFCGGDKAKELAATIIYA